MKLELFLSLILSIKCVQFYIMSGWATRNIFGNSVIEIERIIDYKKVTKPNNKELYYHIAKAGQGWGGERNLLE